VRRDAVADIGISSVFVGESYARNVGFRIFRSETGLTVNGQLVTSGLERRNAGNAPCALGFFVSAHYPYARRAEGSGVELWLGIHAQQAAFTRSSYLLCRVE